MNLKNPNLEELKELIRNCDDENYNHILWVSINGEVHINRFTTRNPSNKFVKANPSLLFWKGVFHRSRKNVGADAANDQIYLENLLDELLKNWKIEYQGHLND